MLSLCCLLYFQTRRTTTELREDLQRLQLVNHRLSGEMHGYRGLMNRRTLVQSGGLQMPTQDASTYTTANPGTPNRHVRFESTRTGDQPGTSPPSAGISPVRASAVQDPPSAPPSNDTPVHVVNETGARSKVRGTAL